MSLVLTCQHDQTTNGAAIVSNQHTSVRSPGRTTILVLTLGLAWLTAEPVEAAAPEIKRIYPAGGQTGSSVTLTLSGKVPDDLQVWISQPLITAQLPPDDSRIVLNIPAEVAPGRYWLRFHNAEGATDLFPFVVGRLPEQLEQEPNNDLPDPAPVVAPGGDGASATRPAFESMIWNGVLHKSGEVDLFPVHLAAGQTLIASLDAHELLGSPMDGVLQIVSERGFVLEQNDDHHGMDPRIVYEASRDEMVAIRVFAFPATPNSTIGFAGGDDYVYRLTLTTGPFVDHVTPLSVTRNDQPIELQLFGWNLPEHQAIRRIEPTVNTAETMVLDGLTNAASVSIVDMPSRTEVDAPPPEGWSIPFAVTGHIATRSERDQYTVRLEKGQKFRVRCVARSINSPVDPVIRVLAPDGKLVKEMDDVGRESLDVRLDLTASTDGVWHLEVRDRFFSYGPDHVYQLIVEPVMPALELNLATNHLMKKVGEPLKVEVTVDRQDGFEGDVSLSIDGLPKELTAAPITVGSKDKKGTLEIQGDVSNSFSGLIKVLGKGSDSEAAPTTARAAITGHTEKTSGIWLTVQPRPADAAAEAADGKVSPGKESTDPRP